MASLTSSHLALHLWAIAACVTKHFLLPGLYSCHNSGRSGGYADMKRGVTHATCSLQELDGFLQE